MKDRQGGHPDPRTLDGLWDVIDEPVDVFAFEGQDRLCGVFARRDDSPGVEFRYFIPG